ncbi:MAG: hypothetical protein ABSA75_13295 [Candidatus Bathyarchaeia archaeon]
MTEKKIVTPTGFIEAKIEIDPVLSIEALDYTRTFIKVYTKTTPILSSSTTVPIGEAKAVPVKPGKYAVKAFLGSLSSEQYEIEVAAGQVVKLAFFFGKE